MTIFQILKSDFYRTLRVVLNYQYRQLSIQLMKRSMLTKLDTQFSVKIIVALLSSASRNGDRKPRAGNPNSVQTGRSRSIVLRVDLD